MSLQASTVLEFKAEPPQTLVVVFPENGKAQRDFCENERTTIESRLSDILEAPVILRFALRSSLERPAENPDDKIETPALENENRKRNWVSPLGVSATENDQSAVVPSVRANYDELRRKVNSNEVARQIQDIFNAELSDLKQTSQNPNHNSNRGYEYE